MRRLHDCYLNDETREKIENSFSTGDFAYALIHKYEDEYELEFRDGYNHTWFYRTYPINTDINEILDDLREFDVWEELETIMKGNLAGKPHIKMIFKSAEDIEESIGATYWNLWETFRV